MHCLSHLPSFDHPNNNWCRGKSWNSSLYSFLLSSVTSPS
jgi:hypothetical protein